MAGWASSSGFATPRRKRPGGGAWIARKSGGNAGEERGRKRYPSAASRSSYARSSKRRSKARQRSARGALTRCVPVSEAKTASASSDIRELVGRAVRQGLRDVLRQHAFRARRPSA